jgi:hypothetical protein
LLDRILAFFEVGKIYKLQRNIYRYEVGSLSELRVIIDHLSKFPLITQKKADFILFKKVVDLMQNKEHLTIEGLQKIVNLRASINLGLSDKLKEAFPNTKPVERPLIQGQRINDPYWLAGFTSGEGCFHVNIFKSLNYKLGETAHLGFSITQHTRDEQLMESLVSYLGCGKVFKRSNQACVDYKVTKISDLTEKVIPFFDKYNIVGEKSQDFEDFKQVAELIQNKVHLTFEGLEEIKKIKMRMNKGRDTSV